MKFGVGYFKFNNNKKLWINSLQDLCDTWSIIRKGGRLIYWCIGVGSESDDTQKRGTSTSNGSMSHASKNRKTSTDDKAEQVAEIKAKLKGKHGSKKNELQYHLWSEVVASGMHTGMHKLPSYSMFGGPRKTPVKQHSNSQASPNTSTAISPASRTMELRGKCIFTLKSWLDCMMLVLTQEEFDKE